MKKLPKLFARNSDGTIQEWEIVVDGNKFATIHGKQNCLMVTSEWTVCEGKNLGKKNATTPEEQAFSEAESRWEKKQKSGGYWLDIKDIDKTKFVEPMLAEHFVDHKHKLKYPVMVDRKYNGMRQVTTRGGTATRKGEVIHTSPHIFEALKPLFKKFPQLVLDGELYNHEYRFKLNEFIKIVRKTKHFTAEDLAKSKEIVKYYVYDGYGFDFKDEGGGIVSEETPCFARRQSLKDLLKDIPYIVVAPFEICHSEEHVMSVYDSYVADGYEGAIVRSWDAPYQHKRSRDLLKVKPEDKNDYEGKIIAINEGTGNWSGVAKTATIEWKGNVFEATFKGTYEELAEVLKNAKDWINEEVTFLHIGYTGKATPTAPKGLPFSPRIDINNCFKGDR
jgi:DNA ligase-1